MFQIKICGVTRDEDAVCVAGAGADAVGLNFCPTSVRCIELEDARRIAQALPRGIARVGVFVNAPVARVRAAYRQVPLDWVQLHGDEPPDYLFRLSDLPILRAFRCAAGKLDEVKEYLARCPPTLPRAVLIDAYAPNAYGGTGQVGDWHQLAGDRPWTLGRPLVLAGGLAPENISAAIAAVQPTAVDAASGVESAPGVKDHRRVVQFVRQARTAFNRRQNPK